MSDSIYSDASYFRTAFWGSWGEKAYLRHSGRITPTKEFELTRSERSGCCETFGALPTHLTGMILAPLSVSVPLEAMTGFPYEASLMLFVGMTAEVIGYSASRLRAPTPRSVRQAGGVGAAVRAKQGRTYLVGLAVGAAIMNICAVLDKTPAPPKNAPSIPHAQTVPALR